MLYGTRSVTMDGIAAALGMSKRTVYENFKDKTDLVHTCIKAIISQHEERNQEIISAKVNVIETIFSFIQEGIKAMSSINPVFFYDMKKYYPDKWKDIQKNNERTALKLTNELLNKGIIEGIFRNDINIPIVSKLFHEQMNLLADGNIFPHNEFDHADLFQNLVINFMRGICTSKGITLINKITSDKKITSTSENT